MNINYSRYMDTVSIRGYDRKTFLNKWRKKWIDYFWKIFKKEADFWRGYLNAYCDLELAKGRDFMNIVEDAEYNRINTTYDPMKCHKFIWWIVNIPFHIECWLCCGWKLHYEKYDKDLVYRNKKGKRVYGYWTYIDKYHMISKLCRYESWPDYKMTWWDKLRFKWITGYKFEETK